MLAVLPPTILSPLKTLTGLPSRTKGTGVRITALCYHTAAATIPPCPALALSATNVPAVGVDHSILGLHSQSQERNNVLYLDMCMLVNYID